jgi:cell division protein ZapA
MAEELISIKVNIGDRSYPLKIKAEEEENVRMAAKMINEKSKFYQQNFAVRDKQDLLAMTALEFASEALNASRKEVTDEEWLENKMRALNNLIGSM